jgi:hypothetical protein
MRIAGLRVPALAGLALTVVAVLVGAIVSIASAELTSSGNLFITFNGGIKPAALPRDEAAPITVWMDGRVRILSGEQPPSATTMTVKLNRNGRLDTRGLPTCTIGELQARSSQEAMEACGDALVGNGTYRARLDFSNEGPTPSHGKILAFNGRKSAVLAQVHSSAPAISTDIIVFDITHPSSGPFGTVLTGTVPPGLSRWGYLKHVSLNLHREYAYRGQKHSYLSAPCPAPAGVRKAAFPFVFASIAFDDGRVLSSTLTRTCTVRGG